ncbi:PREDICTED: F-box/kelch-repeat protein At3g23880-like [Fragaria vesca subsp. vesca]
MQGSPSGRDLPVIFLRLPVKSLLRFRVCKSWRSIISSSTFIDTHCRVGGQLLLLQASLSSGYSSYEPFSLHRNNPSFDDPFLAYDWMQLKAVHVAFKRQYRDLGSKPINVAGTCNGVVCLVAQDFTVLLWNPSIRKFVVLARPSVTLRRDDGVLRAVYKSGRGAGCSSEVEIWSLARGSWKSLTAPMDIPGDSTWYPKAFLLEPHAFVNGALHWFHNKFKRMSYSIVTFDISSESFSEITMPEFWENKGICLMSSYKEYTCFL